MKNLLRTILVAAMAVAPVAAIVTSAHADNRGYAISRGTTLNKGDYLHRTLPGFAVELIMQGDGNLVLKATTGRICWAAGTNPGGDRAVYQSDGNFVVYNSSGTALWASNTVGQPWDTGSTVSINAGGTLYAGYRKISDCTW
ncbi:hypothetical protein J5X84_27350 [Streptosporangiaceae bacterium NEAU-GS5]|nr:hypothetical protein [Streptosporangiaceae bacterium NEAU-GS5]